MLTAGDLSFAVSSSEGKRPANRGRAPWVHRPANPYSSHAMQVCCLRSGSLRLEIAQVVRDWLDLGHSRFAERPACSGSRSGSCDHRFVDELWVGDNRGLAVDNTHERLAVRLGRMVTRHT
jgi:hypothetical protein